MTIKACMPASWPGASDVSPVLNEAGKLRPVSARSPAGAHEVSKLVVVGGLSQDDTWAMRMWPAALLTASARKAAVHGGKSVASALVPSQFTPALLIAPGREA